MAKKKRNAAPAQPEGEKVIDQLFGRLEQEPDIETDIAELGSESEPEAQPPEKTGRSRFFFGFSRAETNG